MPLHPGEEPFHDPPAGTAVRRVRIVDRRIGDRPEAHARLFREGDLRKLGAVFELFRLHRLAESLLIENVPPFMGKEIRVEPDAQILDHETRFDLTRGDRTTGALENVA